LVGGYVFAISHLIFNSIILLIKKPEGDSKEDGTKKEANEDRRVD
jgi:hypothetical protein